MRIETSRLIVRSFEESDVDAYAAIVADPFVTRFLSDGIPHTSLEARHYVYDCIRRDHDTGISRYAVIRKTESDFIGFSGFKEYDDYIDFGWRFAHRVWGHGYGSEAALAILGYGTKVLGLQGIRVCSAIDNIASVRIIEKLGFVFDCHCDLHGRRTAWYRQPTSQ